MTLPELIATLQSWQTHPKVSAIPPAQQFVASDFGILEMAGMLSPELTIDINNDGTLPGAVQGPPE